VADSAELPQSEHFVLQKLAQGRAGSPAFSSVGIIDLGDQTLVLDVFELPAAAADLRSAAEILTGRPVTAVILSHVHADHSVGRHAFAPWTPILTSPTIRANLPAAWAGLLPVRRVGKRTCACPSCECRSAAPAP
jgi:glyoxylase-like metal-dependent hydrolase (beta-lactamase superfamily II)